MSGNNSPQANDGIQQPEHQEHHDGSSVGEDSNSTSSHPYSDSESLNIADGQKSVFTIEEAVEHVGITWVHVLLMFVCGGGMFFDGVELTLSSFLVPFLREQWKLTPFWEGMVGSSAFIGMMLSTTIGGALSDRYGRRIVLIGSSFITAVFSLLCSFSPNIGWYIALRIMTGVGFGCSIPIDNSYLLEFFPKKFRGSAVQWLNVYWNIGAVFECFVAWLFLDISAPLYNAETGWRWVVAVSSIPGFISLFTRLFLYESPRYLLTRGRDEAAMSTVQSIARIGCKKVPNGKIVHIKNPGDELSIMMQFEQILSRKYLITTLLLAVAWFFTSFSGWGYTFILPIVFKKLTNANTYLNTAMVNGIGGISNIILIFSIELMGRKAYLSIFFALSAIFTTSIGFWNNNYYMLFTGMTTTFVNNFAWAVIYVYTPEIYPTQIRNTAFGFLSFITRVGSSLAPIVATRLLSISQFVPFLIFGIGYALNTLCCILLPYETRGKELVDIVSDEPDSMTTPSNQKVSPNPTTDESAKHLLDETQDEEEGGR